MLTRRLTPASSVSASSPSIETTFTGTAKHIAPYFSPNSPVIQTGASHIYFSQRRALWVIAGLDSSTGSNPSEKIGLPPSAYLVRRLVSNIVAWDILAYDLITKIIMA
jgi:hypothetical protein